MGSAHLPFRSPKSELVLVRLGSTAPVTFLPVLNYHHLSNCQAGKHFELKLSLCLRLELSLNYGSPPASAFQETSGCPCAAHLEPGGSQRGRPKTWGPRKEEVAVSFLGSWHSLPNERIPISVNRVAWMKLHFDGYHFLKEDLGLWNYSCWNTFLFP